jgi:hypothetical protein
LIPWTIFLAISKVEWVMASSGMRVEGGEVEFSCDEK